MKDLSAPLDPSPASRARQEHALADYPTDYATPDNERPSSLRPKDFIVPVQVKRPALMAALSFFIPGLGQIGCAQDNKGIFLMGMALLGYWLTGGIATVILCLLSGLDAFIVGRAIQRGSTLRKWDFFPGVKPFGKLPARTIPLIIVLVILAIMTIRVMIFARGDGTQN